MIVSNLEILTKAHYLCVFVDPGLLAATVLVELGRGEPVFNLLVGALYSIGTVANVSEIEHQISKLLVSRTITGVKLSVQMK